MTATPFSLRIFVADGDPDGLRIVERSNWVGRALCSRVKTARAIRSSRAWPRTTAALPQRIWLHDVDVCMFTLFQLK
jgi:hypothetical protein